MGALHDGHLALIAQANEVADITVCSIFVNPTQFNNPDDLKRYPRPVEDDIRKLTGAGCDVAFIPEVEEMYQEKEKWSIDLGKLEHILEGKFRPGHYQGVSQIVNKLLELVKPDIAFFGQKDFQQFKVIEKMVELLNIPVKLVMCPIVRENDGLAMSSRNVHLSADEHRQALILSKTLTQVKRDFPNKSLPELKRAALELLNTEPIKLEYFEICTSNLEPAVEKATGEVALVAAWVGKTRLIDNVIL